MRKDSTVWTMWIFYLDWRQISRSLLCAYLFLNGVRLHIHTNTGLHHYVSLFTFLLRSQLELETKRRSYRCARRLVRGGLGFLSIMGKKSILTLSPADVLGHWGDPRPRTDVKDTSWKSRENCLSPAVRPRKDEM